MEVVLLLDTHTWIWSQAGEARRVGRRARQLLNRAGRLNQIRVSAASIFEVAALHTAGRLMLSVPIERWIREALASPGAALSELTPTIAIDAGCIPRSALADPLDRLLVATARQLDATLLTADRRILDYASQTGVVRVQDARL
jgi:PIN domain nuclease of toxin-antitoxin system